MSETGERYLTFVPKDKIDAFGGLGSDHRNYRLVFETDSKRVVNFRVNKLP